MHVRGTAKWSPIFCRWTMLIFNVFHLSFGFYVRDICKTFAFYRGVYLSQMKLALVNWKAVKKWMGLLFRSENPDFLRTKKGHFRISDFFCFLPRCLPLTIDPLLWIGKSQNNGWDFGSAQKILPFCVEKKIFESFGSMVACFFSCRFLSDIYHKTENKVWHFSGWNWCSSLSKP